MAAAEPSPAEAAFRELLALGPTAGGRPFKRSDAGRAAAAPAPAKQYTPQLTLSQQMQVLRDGASTAGARKSALTALRAWLKERSRTGRHGVRHVIDGGHCRSQPS